MLWHLELVEQKLWVSIKTKTKPTSVMCSFLTKDVVFMVDAR